MMTGTKPVPRVMALIDSRPKPEWLDTFIDQFFSPHGPAVGRGREPSDNFYISFDSMFRNKEFKELIAEEFNKISISPNIALNLVSVSVIEYSEWVCLMNVIKHSIIGINESISTALTNRFSIEYDYSKHEVGNIHEYIKALIRKHNTLSFDKNEKSRRLYRMNVKVSDTEGMLTAYYKRIDNAEPRDIGTADFWIPKQALGMNLKIISSNGRDLHDPKCEITPIVSVSYLDRHQIQRKDFRVCLKMDTFYDVRGGEIRFHNQDDMIGRIKAIMERKL